MKNIYKCPYCAATSTNNRIPFKSWKSVSQHVSSCNKKINNNLVFDGNEGPININIFLKGYSCHKIISLYPNLKNKLSDIRKEFIKKGYKLTETPASWSKSEIIEKIQLFEQTNNRIPMIRDFIGKLYPTHKSVSKNFGSWNKAVEAAGFKADYNDGFGTRIQAKDKVLYRSWYETYFVNTYLYNKYKYIVEPKYPEPYTNKRYDWYIEDLNLYIELDGGCRPEVIEEKIEINNKNNIPYIIIPTNKIKDKEYIINKCLIYQY